MSPSRPHSRMLQPYGAGSASDAPPPPPPDPLPPPSQRPYPAWCIPFPPTSTADMLRLATSLKRFLALGSKGGSGAALRAVILLEAAPGVRMQLESSASTSTALSLYHNPTSQSMQRSSQAASSAGSTLLIFLFDGAGRLKSSLRRSLASLDIPQSAREGLLCLSCEYCLSLMLQPPDTCPRRIEWLGPPRDVIEYLRERIEYSTAEARVVGAASMLCSGMDILGPGNNRKRKAHEPLYLTGPDPDPLVQEPGSTPTPLRAIATDPSGERASPEVSVLRAVLQLKAARGSSAMTEEQAAETATQLLDLIAGLSEENAMLKIANAAHTDPPAMVRGAVCPPAPHSAHPQVVCCVRAFTGATDPQRPRHQHEGRQVSHPGGHRTVMCCHCTRQGSYCSPQGNSNARQAAAQASHLLPVCCFASRCVCDSYLVATW